MPPDNEAIRVRVRKPNCKLFFSRVTLILLEIAIQIHAGIMKSSSTLVALTATILPSLTSALCDLSWSIPNVPTAGLTDITFPINLAKAPRTSGYYFAQQFNFVGQFDVGYTGLQPRPDSGSSTIIHGVFSSFIAGTTSNDPNCSNGADGGSGVSCAFEFTGSYADTYHMVVKNTGGTTWTGTAVDSVTGAQNHIGTYTLPSGSGGIQSSQVGFVEYYPWNSDPSLTCADIPGTDGTFYAPTTQSSSGGAATGSLSGSVDNCQTYITQKSVSGGVEFVLT
jgi:hypothetical protein